MHSLFRVELWKSNRNFCRKNIYSSDKSDFSFCVFVSWLVRVAVVRLSFVWIARESITKYILSLDELPIKYAIFDRPIQRCNATRQMKKIKSAFSWKKNNQKFHEWVNKCVVTQMGKINIFFCLYLCVLFFVGLFFWYSLRIVLQFHRSLNCARVCLSSLVCALNELNSILSIKEWAIEF